LHYFEVEKDAQALYRFTWKDVAETIFLYTEVSIDADSLNQFATSQVSRGKVRGMSPKNLKAIVDTLTDPEINALSLEELNDPSIPYRLIRQLIEFLKPNEHTDPLVPPRNLEGTYRGVGRSEKYIRDIRLAISISEDRRYLELRESADIYRKTSVSDPAEFSPEERRQHFRNRSESRGWGILTPEYNLLGFMKLVSVYGANSYYTAMGSIPRLWDENPVERLVLFGYDVPYDEIESEDERRWFDEICRNVVSYNLRFFSRIAQSDENEGQQ
jgi:hypothetical protein